MPNGLRIDDGPVPWDSPAIRLYNSSADLLAGQNDVNASNLSQRADTYFGIEVSNTSGVALPPPCSCQRTGTFFTPNKQPGAPATARFRGMLARSTTAPSDWTFTVTRLSTTQPTGSAVIQSPWNSPVIFYALTGESLGVIFNQLGTWRFLLVNPSSGNIVVWNSGLPDATNPIVYGFSPNADVFVCYDTTGDNSSSATFYDLVAETERTITFTSPPVTPSFSRVYLFTPCGELVARVPNEPGTKVEFAALRGAGVPFGQLVAPSVNGLPARILVQGIGVSPLTVLSRGDVGAPSARTGIEIVGPYEVTIQSSGMTVSSNTNPRRARIDYRCLQGLPKVEVQVQPSATLNVNKAVADAWAYVELPTGAPQLARCLQPWRSPTNVVPNTPGAHFCAIAEAFTEAPINGISVPRTTAPSFAGLVVSEENIAQQNMLIARASVATALVAVRNPLPFEVESSLHLRAVAGYERRFRNWPKKAARPTRSGIRLFGSETPPQDTIKLKLGAQTEFMVEVVVEVADGAPEPSALAFEVVQAIRDVEAGGVVVVVTHGDLDLIPFPAKTVRGKQCPIDLVGPISVQASAADPAPGTAKELSTKLVDQRVGMLFAAQKDLREVEVYVESSSHPEVNIDGLRVGVGAVAAGTEFFASWACAVASVPEGRHSLLLVAKAAGYAPRRFVVDFDVRASAPWEDRRPWYEKVFGAKGKNIPSR